MREFARPLDHGRAPLLLAPMAFATALNHIQGPPTFAAFGTARFSFPLSPIRSYPFRCVRGRRAGAGRRLFEGLTSYGNILFFNLLNLVCVCVCVCV